MGKDRHLQPEKKNGNRFDSSWMFRLMAIRIKSSATFTLRPPSISARVRVVKVPGSPSLQRNFIELVQMWSASQKRRSSRILDQLLIQMFIWLLLKWMNIYKEWVYNRVANK